MTIRYLSGAYPAGYALDPVYSGLVLEATASVGGAGILASAMATITNDGTVDATAQQGIGVHLQAGGVVTNGSASHTGALIEAQYWGVEIDGPAATVANFGTIQGGEGVYLSDGGRVTNGSARDTAALISSPGDDIVTAGAFATIRNFGTLQSGFFAISVGSHGHPSAGAKVINGSASDTSARIDAREVGIEGSYGSLTVRNFGTITSGGQGVLLGEGRLVNGSEADTTAVIQGNLTQGYSQGVVSLGATVANFGTIIATDLALFILGDGSRVTNGSATDRTALVDGYQGGVLTAGNPESGANRITNYGTIEGETVGGIDAHLSSTTVVNFGTIMGPRFAVDFETAGDVLVVEAGSTFLGAVMGGGGSLVLASGVGTIDSLAGGDVTVSGSLATTTFGNFASLAIGAGARFTLTGAGEIGPGGTTALIDRGALVVTGGLTVGGRVGGSGTLALAGGTTTFDAGAKLAVARVVLFHPRTRVNIATRLTFSGAWTQTGGILAIAADETLSLTGAASLAGRLNGAGRLKLSDAAVNTLTIGGTATLIDMGAVDQTGTLTFGGGTSAAALWIAAGATWTMESASAIASSQAAESRLVNRGTLIAEAGTGIDTIGVRLIDDGVVTAAGGALDLGRAVTGAGALVVENGATLTAGSGVAAGLSLAFAGPGATLALAAPRRFAATIEGFAAGDTIDLLGRAADAAALGPGDTLVITDHGKALATLRLVGDYRGAVFSTASDGRGGTAITVGSPAAAPPVPLHAFLAAAAVLGAAPAVAAAPTLPPAAPRMLLAVPHPAL